MADHTYRYLSALVSQGSFSQAARYLDISQPSLSQFIQRLEAEAGTELIDRTSRPLKAYGRRRLFSADRAAH